MLGVDLSFKNLKIFPLFFCQNGGYWTFFEVFFLSMNEKKNSCTCCNYFQWCFILSLVFYCYSTYFTTTKTDHYIMFKIISHTLIIFCLKEEILDHALQPLSDHLYEAYTGPQNLSHHLFAILWNKTYTRPQNLHFTLQIG